MRDGRGELDGAIYRAAVPKFAHHRIHQPAALQRLQRHGARGRVRLDITLQTVLVAEFGKMAEVIFREQIGEGPARVPEKTLGDRRIVHDAAGKGGQIFQRVVTAPFLKLLAEIGGPVLGADFVAVNQRSIKRLAGERADVVEHFLHEALPMRVERGLAEFVAFQTLASLGRGMIVRTDRRVAKAQDSPIARRRLPVEPAIGREVRR